MLRALEVCRRFLLKATGPGSRGGRVIGQTSGGRPIYAARASGHGAYAGFSAHDHFEAAREHLGRAGILNHRALGPDASARGPAMAARASRHMAHYLGHIRRARRLDAAAPADQRLEALA